MTFKPTADRVLLKRAELETKTAGGLFIPDIQGEQANRGTVVDFGPGRITKKNILVPTELNLGDTVVFGDGAGTPIRVNGEDYLVIKADEIIAVVE
jgi:chaperonin GroES